VFAFIKKHRFELLLGLLISIYIAYFSWFTILRHNAFLSDYYDLGIMDQTVYNTYKGRLLELTAPSGYETIKRPAIHNDIILALIAPFYALHQGPETLLILQSIVLGLGALFVYKIALHFYLNKLLGLAFAFVYLMYPPLQWSNVYDFHGVTLATTFILGFLYFVLKKRWGFSFVFALLALLTKEQVALSIGLFGFYFFITHAKRKTLLKDSQAKFGLFLWAFCVVWFIVGIFIIIPYFRESSHFAVKRYGEFGESESSVLLGILTRPDILIKYIFQQSTFNYLGTLLFPLLFLPVFAPVILSIVPELMINLLSNSFNQRDIIFHYTAVITPFLFFAAIQVVAFFEKRRWNISHYIPMFLIVATLIASYMFSPLPYSKKADTRPLYVSLPERNDIIGWKSKLQDENISLCVSGKLAPHFSNRKQLIRFGSHYEYADFIVIMKTEVIDDWLDGAASRDAYESLVQNPAFKLEYSKGDLEVYKKI